MIPKTYHDGNPEDRAYVHDLWSWLREQPQDAWLLWARRANWDNATDIFEQMIDDPDCDRAIASWLFWSSGPASLVENPGRFERPSLGRRILENLARGHYPRAELGYDRYEVVHDAQAYIGALARAGRTAPFAVPRALCGPFDGRPATLPRSYDPETERDLAELFKYLDGSLPRSEAQHREEEGRAGNLWIKPLFRLPAAPGDPQALANLDDLSFLEAIFGNHRAYLAAREAAAKRRRSTPAVGPLRQPLLGRAEKRILKLLGLFALLAIGGALVAHRLQTGSW